MLKFDYFSITKLNQSLTLLCIEKEAFDFDATE